MSRIMNQRKCTVMWSRDRSGVMLPCGHIAAYEPSLCWKHKGPNAVRIARDPLATEKRLARDAAHALTVQAATEHNAATQTRGSVTMNVAHPILAIPPIDGHLNVFVSQWRPKQFAGMILRTVYPGAIGPIFHGEPRLPVARFLDNYLSAHERYTREQYPYYAHYRDIMFRDKEGHQCKRQRWPYLQADRVAYYSWRMPSGRFRRLSAVEFRQVLCVIYARKIRKNAEYLQLQELVARGTNVRLMGYTAHDMTHEAGRSLEAIYLDPSVTIGHEFVLLCLLRGEAPWEGHTTLPNIFRSRTQAYGGGGGHIVGRDTAVRGKRVKLEAIEPVDTVDELLSDMCDLLPDPPTAAASTKSIVPDSRHCLDMSTLSFCNVQEPATVAGRNCLDVSALSDCDVQERQPPTSSYLDYYD